jgi:hypothetical protein
MSARVPHKCPPCWLVFIGEDSCPDYGKADNSTPSSDENDWVEVYALDESEAAEKYAEKRNTEGDYYLMNETYPVWVRPFPCLARRTALLRSSQS